MDLFQIGLLFGLSHLAVIYYATDVAKLEYRSLMTVVGGMALVTAVIARVFEPNWKPRLQAIMEQDKRDGSVLGDIGGMLLAIVVCNLIGLWLMYRRYGVAGWLGAVGVNAVVSAVV